MLRLNGFPENFILTNPQFGCSVGCTPGAATLLTNGAHSNYHSLQVLATFRNIGGFNFQTSYTWSKELGVGTAGFTDPRNQDADYTLLRTNRTHVVRTFGSFDLPVGPGKGLRKQPWRSCPCDRRLADELDCQPPDAEHR